MIMNLTVLKTLLAVVSAVSLSMALPLMFELESRADANPNVLTAANIQEGMFLKAYPVNLETRCRASTASTVSTAKIYYAVDKRLLRMHCTNGIQCL
jgi:hypothetical protein